MALVKVIDKQEGNHLFSIEAVHFLRLYKAYPGRFEPADEVGKKLIKEIPIEDIDIGTTKTDEELWEMKKNNAQEKERIDKLEKVIAQKLATVLGKEISKEVKQTEANIPEIVQEESNPVYSKKQLEAMDIAQLQAIYYAIYPNKEIKNPTKKLLIAEILR